MHKITSEPTYYFNQELKEWQEWDYNKNYFTKNSLSLASYNVLFDQNNIIKYITCDKERHLYQISNLLPGLNSDLIGLNEVTENYIQLILEQDWIQKDYFIFNPYKKGGSFGNFIISKLPLRFYVMNNLIFKRIIIGLIVLDCSKPEKSLLIISVHLTAFEKNYEKRKNQLKMIIQSVRNYNNEKDELNIYFKNAVQNNNIIIMGDLNFHLTNETNYIYENDFIDLWLESNQTNHNGYTWDATKNSLINMFLPLDTRRMRLDRIIMANRSTHIDLYDQCEMKIFGDKKITNRVLSYLTGSDHYGLKINLKINEKAKPYIRKIDFENLNVRDQHPSLFTTMRCQLFLVMVIVKVVLIIYFM